MPAKRSSSEESMELALIASQPLGTALQLKRETTAMCGL